MDYLNNIENNELRNYLKLLSKDYPDFIGKYILTNELQRLKGIGQFCGCDYTKCRLSGPKFIPSFIS